MERTASTQSESEMLSRWKERIVVSDRINLQSSGWTQNNLTRLGWTAVDPFTREHFVQGWFGFLSVLIVVCLSHRLVNENEVKQWRDQAEKFRKGKLVWDTALCRSKRSLIFTCYSAFFSYIFLLNLLLFSVLHCVNWICIIWTHPALLFFFRSCRAAS